MHDHLLDYLSKTSPKTLEKSPLFPDAEMESMQQKHETFLKLSDALVEAFATIHPAFSQSLSKK